MNKSDLFISSTGSILYDSERSLAPFSSSLPVMGIAKFEADLKNAVSSMGKSNTTGKRE